MGALAGKIGQPAGADKTNFEDYFSASYYKYYGMYEITSGKDTVELTDTEKSLVDEYVATLRQYFVVYGNIYQIIQSGYTVNDDVYPILYGLYAKASEIRATLTAQGNDVTGLYMYTVEHEFGNLKYTLEKAYYVADSVTTSLLTSMSAIITQDNGALRYTTYWEIYKNEAVESFLPKYAYLLYSAYFEDGKEVGQPDLNAAMDDMRKFTNYETSIIVLLNIDDTVYKSMSTYYKTVLTENGLAVSDKLITAAKAYTTYSLGANDENLAAFASAMENLKADYDALSDEDKAYLSGMYSYYSGLLDSLMNNSDAEA
jgi:hypothetical protein